MSNKMTRRKAISSALGFGAVYLCPLEKMFLNMINGMCGDAHAAVAGLDPMNYLIILAGGGPNLRVWNTILQTNENDILLTGDSICTNFSNYNSSDKSFDLEYSTILHKGLYLPHMNQMEARLSNGDKQLKYLMDNSLHIRGVNLGSQGHGTCTKFITEPVAGGITTTGHHADLSNRLFPHTSHGHIFPFRSVKGLSGQKVSSHKPFKNSLFGAKGSKESEGMSYSNSQIETKIDGALDILKEMSLHSNPKVKSMYGDRSRAKKMFKTAVDIFETEYEDRRKVYAKTLRDTLDNMYLENLIDGKEYRVDPKDTRSKIGKGGYPTNAHWLSAYRDGSHLNIGQIADGLAYAEVAFKYSLSSSISVSAGKVGGLWLSNKSSSMASDAHNWGAIPLMLFNTMRWAGTAAVILEFVERLKTINVSAKGVNLFEDTLVQISSEFPNTPLGSKDSGHGGEGQHVTLLSGKFKSDPLVVGNIEKGSLGAYWGGTGTWGKGAAVSALGGRTLNRGNLASTVCDILGSTSPTANDQSIVKVDSSGNMTNLIDDAKIIS